MRSGLKISSHYASIINMKNIPFAVIISLALALILGPGIISLSWRENVFSIYF